jgi:hypothetical protein
LNQYGSNLLGGADIFPLLAKLNTPSVPSPVVSGILEDSEGEQPPFSSSLLSESASPEVAASVKRLSPGKALHLSVAERAEAGISPTWESDPDRMREKERRSKSNMDRPSKSRALAGAGVATQLVFEDDSGKSDGETAGETILVGAAVDVLAAPVARAPRSRPPMKTMV